MAHPKLFLAAACLTILMSASNVAAITCPADQTFKGVLLPTHVDSIDVTTTVQGDTTFHFIPQDCGRSVQTFTMYLGGGSVAGDCSLATTLLQAQAGTYTVELTGSFLGMDEMAAMPYKLVVHQTNCA